ncbi:uncharacterized protein BDR25DRAFT_394101 [Lindgomyces ingoldianus]|uniref:Uncharacterized protein n=1 Tax=Lindgomyces ingoldianus TaxID=673940 RepID=A0ACB6QVU9_9PLEO|nr:uncharacterized protein BDR25DRAFT_394101 [Lindgomyces ingoldianus]KAF2470197.1 hypothetical protein BDR25DRAFT_394101 [Lindgomyces ingoldianus]
MSSGSRKNTHYENTKFYPQWAPRRPQQPAPIHQPHSDVSPPYPLPKTICSLPSPVVYLYARSQTSMDSCESSRSSLPSSKTTSLLFQHDPRPTIKNTSKYLAILRTYTSHKIQAIKACLADARLRHSMITHTSQQQSVPTTPPMPNIDKDLQRDNRKQRVGEPWVLEPLFWESGTSAPQAQESCEGSWILSVLPEGRNCGIFRNLGRDTGYSLEPGVQYLHDAKLTARLPPHHYFLRERFWDAVPLEPSPNPKREIPEIQTLYPSPRSDNQARHEISLRSFKLGPVICGDEGRRSMAEGGWRRCDLVGVILGQKGPWRD